MKISELLDGIRKRDLVLPEFQREYVWSREQAKQLIVSLVKDYPVGSLLFWKTDTPPDLKNIEKLPEKLGTIQVILDGQQRLTTLYMLMTGQIPPYYRDADIETDPRDLYFNIGDCEFQYYQATRMKDNPLWRRVVDCLGDGDIDVFRIAQQLGGEDAFQHAKRYNDNLTALRNVRNTDMAVQTVPPGASLDDAIDIFDRVNSQGTKLTDAELALTHITGKWPHARRAMKAKIDELSARHFAFDLTFMVRALTGVVKQRALFEEIHDRGREELIAGWTRLTKILDYLVSLLPTRAYIHSTEDLNTTNVLVPWIVHLSMRDGKFTDERNLKSAVHWLYAATMWSRYTSQTDQRLEHDVSLVVRESSPWKALCDQIIDQRGRIEVKANDLEGRTAQHPLYRMTFVLSKAHAAVDWSNGAPLGSTHGKAYRVHSHHVFPQSVLYKNGYDPDNHLHRKVVNEIANRAFLTADSNFEFSDAPPDEYLPEVDKRFPGALQRQFIPTDPSLWKVERFEDFLEARRSNIARKINEFMNALIAEPVVARERSTADLVGLGESATLEFKSTLQWDVVQGKHNKELRHSVLKTIGAFLNSDGGTLIIGVEDDGKPYGIENDLRVLGGSRDDFEQLLCSMIKDHIGIEFARSIKFKFDDLGGKTVCLVEVEKATEPAFVKGSKDKEFFVRLGNTTRPLDREETVKYIKTNWE